VVADPCSVANQAFESIGILLAVCGGEVATVLDASIFGIPDVLAVGEEGEGAAS